MSYTERFLKTRGQDCTIERIVPVNTKVSMKRSTKASRDLGIREGYWEGLALKESDLKSGETINITDTRYLVQTSNIDQASKQIAFFSAKCNVVMNHKRYIETVDNNWNAIKTWGDVNPERTNIHCYGEVVTSRIRQEEPGLLENTIYIFQVPRTLGVLMLDRFIHREKKYQVISIDDIGLEGVDRVQLAIDTRPD